MRYPLILAAAAFLAVGCHNRSEDETGAAPDRGDAAVTATDTAAVKTDSTMGAVPEAAVTDSAAVSDTTSAAAEAPLAPDSAAAQAVAQPSDSTGIPGDSTAAKAPADTTAKQ
jgi:hypothetical protein